MAQRFVMVVVLLTVVATWLTAGLLGQDTTSQAFALKGQVALWTIAVKPDKTADFERVMARLSEALRTSSKPERRQQLAGWKVMKVDTPLPDGNIAYVHLINPVVPGADYNIMQTLYEELPDERQALYELYRGAFVQNLSLATGNVAIDLSQSPATVTTLGQ